MKSRSRYSAPVPRGARRPQPGGDGGHRETIVGRGDRRARGLRRGDERVRLGVAQTQRVTRVRLQRALDLSTHRGRRRQLALYRHWLGLHARYSITTHSPHSLLQYLK